MIPMGTTSLCPGRIVPVRMRPRRLVEQEAYDDFGGVDSPHFSLVRSTSK
jgi:hypothetical protein